MHERQPGTRATSRHGDVSSSLLEKSRSMSMHIREPETKCLRAALEAALDRSSERHDEEPPVTRYIEKKSCADAIALKCQKRGRFIHVGNKTRRPSVNRRGSVRDGLHSGLLRVGTEPTLK